MSSIAGISLRRLYRKPPDLRTPEGKKKFDRVSIYESDIASLIQRQNPPVEPLLQRLQSHLQKADMTELRGIVRDIEARIARFDQLKKK